MSANKLRQIMIARIEDGETRSDVARSMRIATSTVYKAWADYKARGTTNNNLRTGRKVGEAREDNKDAVLARITEDPNVSVRQLSREFNIPQTTIRRLVNKDLGLKSLAKRVSNASPSKKGGKKARESNPWESDASSGTDEVDSLDGDTPVKERSKRNVKTNKKYSFSDDEESKSDDEDMELFDNDAIKEEKNHETKRTLDVSDTDDDFGGGDTNGNHSEDEFDAMLKKTSAAPAAKTKKAARVPDSESDEPIRKVAKKAPAKKAAKPKKLMALNSDDEDNDFSYCRSSTKYF